jgi:RND family efflux transporter MFP subunit
MSLRDRLRAAIAGRPLQPAPWMFFPPLAIGLIVLGVAFVLAPGAQRVDEERRAIPVRVMIVEPQSFVPALTGFGEARPDRAWQAIAQVPGRISHLHPELKDGAVIAAGTLLLEIDPTDYALAVKRAEAAKSLARARIDELDMRRVDLAESIEIETRALSIAEREFDRRRTLFESGHISRLEADAEEQRLLRQRQSLQSMRGQVNLIPAQQAALRAQLQESEAQLAKALEDLNRTRVTMPFDGRIERVQVEATQFVAAGQPMFAAGSTDAVEVVLRVPPEQLWARFPDLLDRRGGIELGAALSAEVSYEAGDLRLSWPGRVIRVDPSVDPVTRTAQLYIRVENVPDGGASPLGGHLYVRVRVEGPASADRIVIPRMAHHGGFVHVVDGELRARRRPIDVAFRQDDVIVVAGGLEPGEMLILSELLFPVDGMPVVIANGAGMAQSLDQQ